MGQLNLSEWLIFVLICVQPVESMDFLGHVRDIVGHLRDRSDELVDYPFKLSFEELFANTTKLSALNEVSSECQTDLRHISAAIKNRLQRLNDSFWDNVMPNLIDASGKPMTGILRGHSTFVGMTQQCEKIHHNYTEVSRKFRGQYIRVVLNQGFKNYSECPKQQVFYSWDLCFPYSCTQPDLQKLFRTWLSGPQGYSPVCTVARLRDNPVPLNYQSYIVLGIMAAVFGICLLASLYDAFILPHRSPLEPESFGLTCFRCFSSYTIIGEILSVSIGKKPGQIPQLHCMRFFSMCWVILGHTMGAFLILTWNIADVFEVVGSFGGQILVNSYYAVDTFFFQSGLLLSFLWFRAYSRNPKRVTSLSSWAMFYVHRVLRLSPAYFMVIAFYTFVFTHYVAQLPLFFGLPGRMGECKTKFWYNFLYVNNIIGVENPCYVVSWYLATDMQMYIFAPLLIIPFTYSTTFGVTFSLIVLALSTLANFLEIIIYRFPPSDFSYGWQDPKMTVSFDEYTRLIYNAAWIRCQVYIIGFLLGYFLHRTPKLKMSRVVNLVGWVLCLAMVVAVILPIRQWSLGHPLALGWRAIFSSLCRIGWGLILSWIIIACQFGYGGPINTFLSWDGWLPLGRLSYSAYLIHLLVAIQFMGFSDSGLIFTSLFQAFCIYSAPVIVFTYLLSLIWSSTFEVPFAKVEALLTTRLLGVSLRVERPPQQAVAPTEVDKAR